MNDPSQHDVPVTPDNFVTAAPVQELPVEGQPAPPQQGQRRRQPPSLWSYPATYTLIGINVGVAAPMAYFPFSGWGESFFGDLHAQAEHGVEFYTQTKDVVERRPKEWSRKF